MSMIRYLAFQMSKVFPEDDPLSEWLITLALAMNDLALVHVRLDEDPEEPDRAFYWNRLAVSHFTEAALFLRDTADVPEVRAFVESLGDEARTKCDKCLAIFHEYRGKLFSKRNKTTFHDRALRPANPQADPAHTGSARRAVRRPWSDPLSADPRRTSLVGGRCRGNNLAREVGGLDAVPVFEARVAAGTRRIIETIRATAAVASHP
jgi:hypothetical protein